MGLRLPRASGKRFLPWHACCLQETKQILDRASTGHSADWMLHPDTDIGLEVKFNDETYRFSRRGNSSGLRKLPCDQHMQLSASLCAVFHVLET